MESYLEELGERLLKVNVLLMAQKDGITLFTFFVNYSF